MNACEVAARAHIPQLLNVTFAFKRHIHEMMAVGSCATLAFLLGGALLAHVSVFTRFPAIAMMKVSQDLLGPLFEWNTFLYDRIPLPDLNEQLVVRRSPDLLYLAAFYDLEHGPVEMSGVVPDMYWSLSLFDTHTNNFHVMNSEARAEGEGFRVWLVGPNGDASPRSGVTVVRSPTDRGFIINRVALEDLADTEWYVRHLQERFTLTPQGGATTDAPPLRRRFRDLFFDGEGTAWLQPSWMAWALCGLLLASRRGALARVALGGGAIVAIGLAAGGSVAMLRPPLKMGLWRAMNIIPAEVNAQWVHINTVGSGHANMYTRTVVAVIGIFGLRREEAMYYDLLADESGEALVAGRDYVLAGNAPPPCRWWSVTLYDAETNFLVANPAGKYSFSSAGVGSGGAGWRVHVGMRPPEPRDGVAGWLPTGTDRERPFLLCLRCYVPGAAMLANSSAPTLPTLHRKRARRRDEDRSKGEL